METKSYKISKHIVWEAYKKVKANKGAAGVDNINIEKTIRFSTQMYSYNLEFLALRSAVTAYRDFCEYMPPYLRIGRDKDKINYTINIAKKNGIHLQPEYFSRFDKLNEIVAKLDIDYNFFESLQEDKIS